MGKPGSFPTDSNSGKAQLARDRKKDVCAARGQGNQLVLGRLPGGTCREVASALGPLVSRAAVQIFQSASSHSVCAAFNEVGEVGFGREGTQEISVE